MDDPVRRVVARVFNVPYETVDDGSSPDTIRAWDSVGHLELVTALSEELAIELEADDIVEMENVGAVKEVVQRKMGRPNGQPA